MTTKKQSTSKSNSTGVALYHVMHAHENFEETALILMQLIHTAQQNEPGKARFMYLNIEGHRNAKGGFDHDAFELINEFGLGVLLPYLTRLHTPLMEVENAKGQNDQVPDALGFDGEAPRGAGGGTYRTVSGTKDDMPPGSVFFGAP